MMKKFWLFVAGFIFFLTSQAIAQNKVVVIPLFDDEATSSAPPAPVEKTGQTTCYDQFGMVIDCPGNSGQDGDLQKGVAWPNPRFTDNLNGTVTDNLTGLIWMKDSRCFGLRQWDEQVSGEGDALSDCNGLAAGYCGILDSSSAGDWRLPNVKELQTLIDHSNYDPALPSGHPFTNVGGGYYFWSSSTHTDDGLYAWFVHFTNGRTNIGSKASGSYYVWCVRDGN